MWKKLLFLLFLLVGSLYGSAEAVRQAGGANLAVSVTDSPDPAILFTHYTYTVVVSNSGPDAATGVVLEVTVPLGLEYISNSAGCVWNKPILTCTIGNLSLNGSTSITVTGKPHITGSLFTTATVSGTQTDPNPANNTETEKTIINPPVGSRTIQFANQQWYVKLGTKRGPGDNDWSDSPESVWVDAQGRLHLKIRKIDDKWWAAEVFTMMPYNYGTYQFFVDSNLNAVDQNIVVGLFLYQDDLHEIDVEVSRWGMSTGDNAQFVIQPDDAPNHRQQFSLNSAGPTVHEIIWRPDSVRFTSFQGSNPIGAPVIHTWEHAHTDIPQQEREMRLHLNLWMNNLDPLKMPANGQEFEVILSNVKFAPLPATPTLSFPANGSSSTVLQPTLFWQYTPNAVKYEVQIGQGNPPTAAPVTMLSTAYTLPSPLAPGTYYWRVRALNTLNTPSAWSPVWSFTITSFTGAAPSRNYFTTPNVLLTWYGVPWATGYEVQVDNQAGFISPEFVDNTLSGSATSVTTTPLASGLYYWRVRAKKPDGSWGLWSPVDSFTIAGG